MRKLQQFIVGSIIGATFGSVLGLILAPKSGKELRDEVTQRFGSIVNEVQKAVAEKKEELEEEIEL